MKNTTREAVAKRINELLKEKNMSRYRLAMNSGVAQSTIGTIINSELDDVKFSRIVLIAGGFDMTVSQFLDSPLFDEDNLKL